MHEHMVEKVDGGADGNDNVDVTKSVAVAGSTGVSSGVAVGAIVHPMYLMPDHAYSLHRYAGISLPDGSGRGGGWARGLRKGSDGPSLTDEPSLIGARLPPPGSPVPPRGVRAGRLPGYGRGGPAGASRRG